MTDGVRVVWFGKEVEAVTRLRAVEGLRAAGEYLRDRANEQAPELSGALRASATVDVDEAALTVAIAYHEPYALKQHEDTDLNHPVGRSKWLQLTMQEEQEPAFAILAERTRI